MLSQAYGHLDGLTAVMLFGIGFALLLLDKNLMKKIIGFSMMDSGIYLFLASYGYIEPGVYTIVDEQDGWGLLKAYAEKRNGWVKLSYTGKV